MLKQRVITALVLLAAVIALLAAPSPWFSLGMLVFFGIGVAEWSALVGGRPRRSQMVFAILACAMLWLPLQTWWSGWDRLALFAMALASGYWAFGGLYSVLRVKVLPVGDGGAVFLLLSAWAAASALNSLGVMVLLTSMLVVWAADTLAYFAGRAFGRHKLAPRVSPGKTWEGVAGGVVGAIFIAWLMAQLVDTATFYDVLVEKLGLAFAVLAIAAMAALSVIGDLHESLLKRVAGVKDSGKILPGHGGVLDRVDGLIAALPLAVLLIGW